MIGFSKLNLIVYGGKLLSHSQRRDTGDHILQLQSILFTESIYLLKDFSFVIKQCHAHLGHLALIPFGGSPQMSICGCSCRICVIDLHRILMQYLHLIPETIPFYE